MIFSRHFLLLTLMCAAPLLTAGVSAADEVGDAMDRFFRSSVAAEQALEGALKTAAPEARPSLERALGEVRATRDRTRKELTGARTSTEGKVRALEAVDQGTQTHLWVLEGVRDRVPSEAKPAIERAMEVSRTGRDTALGAVGGSGIPEAAREAGPPSGVSPGPPAGSGYGRGPSGVSGGLPAGGSGGLGGVRGGPPVGRPGR